MSAKERIKEIMYGEPHLQGNGIFIDSEVVYKLVNLFDDLVNVLGFNPGKANKILEFITDGNFESYWNKESSEKKTFDAFMSQFYLISEFWLRELYKKQQDGNYDERNEDACKIGFSIYGNEEFLSILKVSEQLVVKEIDDSSRMVDLLRFLDKTPVNADNYNVIFAQAVARGLSFAHRTVQEAFSLLVFCFISKDDRIKNLIKDGVIEEDFYYIPII